jgi:hypothetical protein
MTLVVYPYSSCFLNIEFPPHDMQGLATTLEIPDPWTGPATYAEDFYSGGDVRQSALAAADPDILPSVLDNGDQFFDEVSVGQGMNAYFKY